MGTSFFVFLCPLSPFSLLPSTSLLPSSSPLTPSPLTAPPSQQMCNMSAIYVHMYAPLHLVDWSLSSFPSSISFTILSPYFHVPREKVLHSTQECHPFLFHSSAYAANRITLGFGTPALAQFPGIGNWEVVFMDWCRYSLVRCRLMSPSLT